MFLIATFGFINGQNCLPDSSYIPVGPGLYPLPDTSLVQDPTLGINKDAYENCFFDFTFTMVVPDSIVFPNSPPVKLTTMEFLNIEFDYGTVNTGVEGFTCEPPSCIWDGGTTGCVEISGIILVPPGQYDAILFTEIFLDGFPNPFLIEFPSPNLVVAQYRLNVYPMPATGCSTGIDDVNNHLEFTKASPNPFNETTTIFLHSKANFITNFTIYNILGETIETKKVHLVNGENKINFDGSNLSAGMYMVTIGKGKDLITERLIYSK